MNIAVMAIAPVAIARPAAAGIDDDDAELLEFGRQLEELYPELMAAYAADELAAHLVGDKLEEWCKSNGIPSSGPRTKKQQQAWLDFVDNEAGRDCAWEVLAGINDRIEPLYDRVMSLPATTLPGLGVKARGMALFAYPYLWDREDDGDQPLQSLRSLIESICTAAGVSLKEITDRPPLYDSMKARDPGADRF
jgi:hypothetical protein